MIGSSDSLRGEPGEAIETLAQSLILILRDLQEKREFLCGLAIEFKGARHERCEIPLQRMPQRPFQDREDRPPRRWPARMTGR